MNAIQDKNKENYILLHQPEMAKTNKKEMKIEEPEDSSLK